MLFSMLCCTESSFSSTVRRMFSRAAPTSLSWFSGSARTHPAYPTALSAQRQRPGKLRVLSVPETIVAAAAEAVISARRRLSPALLPASRPRRNRNAFVNARFQRRKLLLLCCCASIRRSDACFAVRLFCSPPAPFLFRQAPPKQQRPILQKQERPRPKEQPSIYPFFSPPKQQSDYFSLNPFFFFNA